MHRRVVGNKYDKTPVYSGDGRVYKCVSSHVEADVLHADQRAFAHVRHAESRLHGRFFISTPAAEDIPFSGKSVVLYIFCDFGRRVPGKHIRGQSGSMAPNATAWSPNNKIL